MTAARPQAATTSTEREGSGASDESGPTEQRITGGSGTVGKGLALLELLAEHPHGATAGRLVADSGYAFSTCYRLLTTLVDAGFAEFNPSDKRYSLGLRVFELGQRVATARGYSGTALPVLRGVTEATGESSLLAVLDEDRFLTVHTVDGPHHRITTDPGDRGELHTSALGRALLAFSPDDARERLLDTIDLGPRTERSLTDRAALRDVVDQVRERGWASQDQEHDYGMCAVAVPIMSAGGPLQAALALAAPVHRCDLAGLERHLPLLRAAAAHLATLLPQRS